MNHESSRAEALALWGQMEAERDLYLPEWRDISDYVVPWRGRYLTQRGPGRPDALNLGADILNSVAGGALRTLAAGMMSSLTNPARPWFRLTTADPTLSEIGAVRAYLFTIERLLQWIFARSNVHNELHVCYRDMPAFGQAPLHIDEDDKDVIRAYVLPIGQYALWTDARARIDSVGRKFFYTVRQLRQRFGEENLSRATRKLLDRGELNQRREVLHLIMPNEDFEWGAYGAKGMAWRSCWMELAAEKDEGFLRVGGYRQFPTASGRWDSIGTEEVYGHGPVREFLPDIKQLQHMEGQKIVLVDKAVAPPTQSPPGAEPPSLLAGAATELPTAISQGSEYKPIYIPDYRAIQESRISVQELEYRIKVALHEDLWKLLITRDQENKPGGMTATEVATRHEEALTQLGPVVDRVHTELLSVLIRRTLTVAAERRILPPPPRELVQALARGEDVRIEYISVMAQAQRLLGLGAIERFSSIAINLAQAFGPEVADKIDTDEMLDQAADMLGIPPSIVRPDDEAAQRRIARARNQQQAAQMQAQMAGAKTAQSLGNTPMNTDSALTRLLSQYGPAAQSTQTNVPGAIA